MCTFIAKVTDSRVTILRGPCCMSVEEIQALCPKISRANGWDEYSVDEGVPERPTKIVVDLARDVLERLPISPVAELTYRKQTLHFRSKEQVRVVRSYIAATLRNARNYPPYKRYLECLPKHFLAKHDRAKVLKRLDALLAELPPGAGVSRDAVAYSVSDGVGIVEAARAVKARKRQANSHRDRVVRIS